jgi:hypothetical protein
MSERRALGLVTRLIAYYGALAAAALLFERVRAGAGQGRLSSLLATRAAAATLATLGALALVLPVAWVYMRTKPKERYDSSLVHTLIILPVVIAGVVLIVHDSIALAFSLAGIVAAVRFRNTLRDTKDAVYILLAIAVGLSAGVQVFEVAFVVSAVFIAVVIVLWRFDIGAAPAAERVRGRLVVETAIPTAAHPVIAGVLEHHARRWKLVGSESAASGYTSLTFLVQLRPRINPDALVAAVQREAAAQITNVRFEPDSR